MFKKKIIPFIFIFVILSSFLCFSVSALNSNGATLTGVAASFDDGTGINASVNNYADRIEVVGNGAYGMTEVSIRYQFESPNNYGRFSIVVKPMYGNISLFDSVYNGIYIDNKKSDDWHMGYGTYGANTVDFFYEGYIPKNFNTKIYYNMTNYSVENTYTYYVVQFTFIPIDKGSQDVINNQNQNTQSIINNQNSNRQEITSNNNWNTDREIQADKENTQSIIDNQNSLAEQEKQEITNSGGQATDSMDSIPNESEGFINALGNLVSALSYNGTDCKWTLPQVKMPQIANIVPEMVLIEQQDIDFCVWVQKLPSNILNLIQAVCTGALIVYCFKELYGTISYVFTLKGGGE